MTLVVLTGMAAATGVLVVLSTRAAHIDGSAGAAITGGFIAAFVSLFVLSGIGNASVFKLIPSIFEARSRSLDINEAARRSWTDTHSGALIGLTGAVGALGGVAINLTLRQSYLATGTATAAFGGFLGCYLVAAMLTWRRYVRRPAAVSGMLSPAAAGRPGADLIRR